VGGKCSAHGDIRDKYILVGNPNCKRQFIRHKHRWEDDIKMDFRKVGLEGVDWINLDQDRDQWWLLLT
jgi:hypothetical protein